MQLSYVVKTQVVQYEMNAHNNIQLEDFFIQTEKCVSDTYVYKNVTSSSYR